MPSLAAISLNLFKLEDNESFYMKIAQGQLLTKGLGGLLGEYTTQAWVTYLYA